MGFANRRLGALLIGFSVAAFASQGPCMHKPETRSLNNAWRKCMLKCVARTRLRTQIAHGQQIFIGAAWRLLAKLHREGTTLSESW